MSTPLRPSRSRSTTPRSARTPHHRSSSPLDSPSRQLYEDFSRILIRDSTSFNRSLDLQAAEQEKLHSAALELSARQHEEVRASAERVRRKVELEIERARRERVEQDEREIEQRERELRAVEREAQRRRAEAERVEREEVEREEAERGRLAKLEVESREREERERRVREDAERRAREDAERTAREVAERTAREEAEARESAARPPPPLVKTTPAVRFTNGVNGTALNTPTNPAGPSTQVPPKSAAAAAKAALTSSSQERMASHKLYLDLHIRLKAMRKHVFAECVKLGTHNDLSDMRRGVKSKLGMLNFATPAENKKHVAAITQILVKASTIARPTIDVTSLFVTPPSLAPNTPVTGPGTLVFLLSHFAKLICTQFIDECGEHTTTADPIGIAAASVFSNPNFYFHGYTLIDFLWAKYHFLIPALFGINADMEGQRGRELMGWPREDKSDPSSAFLANEHIALRWTGLGAGFCALTLRNFTKSRNASPAPNRLWWEALSRILNLDPEKAHVFYFALVKALIEDHIPRILEIYGGAGKALVKHAVTVWAMKGDGARAEVTQLRSLAFFFRERYRLEV